MFYSVTTKFAFGGAFIKTGIFRRNGDGMEWVICPRFKEDNTEWGLWFPHIERSGVGGGLG